MQEDRTEQVRQLVASIAPDFTFTALRLEDVFRPPHSNSDSNSVCGVSTSVADLPYSSVSSSVTPRERLVALLSPSSSSSSFSPTSRAALQRSLLNTLLISHVAHSGSEILLLGDTGTRSAIRTLAGMSEGRGYSIGEEVALERIVRVPASSFSGDDEMVGDEDEDKVNKGDKVVMVLRPLGQTVDKEIAFYNRECALDGARGPGDADGAVDVAVVPEVSAKTRSIPSLVEGEFFSKLFSHLLPLLLLPAPHPAYPPSLLSSLSYFLSLLPLAPAVTFPFHPVFSSLPETLSSIHLDVRG